MFEYIFFLHYLKNVWEQTIDFGNSAKKNLKFKSFAKLQN